MVTDKLTHLSLFSGIGGLDLAAEAAGLETVGQCEWGDFQNKILNKHWPDVPKWKNICDFTGKDFYEKTKLRTVTVISGGFPCQPFSTAGNRKGKDDVRYLWPEMLRVIEELHPAWVIGENVAGIGNMELDDVLISLEKQGYETRAFLFPACAIGALHRRNRFAIVAYSGGNGWANESVRGKSKDVTSRGKEIYIKKNGDKIVDTRIKQLGLHKNDSKIWNCDFWIRQPGICRMVDGVPEKLDRLKALGNAVVPQQFFPIFDSIVKLEKSSHD